MSVAETSAAVVGSDIFHCQGHPVASRVAAIRSCGVIELLA